MKGLKTLIVTLGMLGFASGAQAQQARLFFEGDIVRGDQPGAPGPFCVLSNQFKRMEKVVFRVRVLDSTGAALDNKGLKSVFIQLPDGTRLQARHGLHPPPHIGKAMDTFWSAAWIVPENYPSGTFAYKVVATDLQGNEQSWEPFKNINSQFTVIAGTIEFKSK